MIFLECTFRKRKKGRRLLAVIAFLLILAIISVSYANNKLDPLVRDTAIPQLRNLIAQIINESVDKILDSGHGRFVSVIYGDGGKIISIETDPLEINKFRTSVSREIAARLSVLEEYYVNISLANVFDDEVILGRFPDWRLRASVEPNGGTETSVESTLTSAGINQSLHRIDLSVTVGIKALLLISTVDVTNTTNVCIAETVIIGEVPSVYLGNG